MPLGADQDVDQGTIVEIPVIELGRDPALVKRPSLLDLFGQLLEQAVVLESAHDLFLVVERDVAGDGASQTPGCFFRFDQGHRKTPENQYRRRRRSMSKERRCA